MKTAKKIVKPRSKKLFVSGAVSTKKSMGYETDFSEWANHQAALLRKKEFAKLDIDNLIEEIEDLSKREKQRLTSYLENLLMNKLKIKFQPGMHTTSWDLSIKEANHKAQKTLSENPSLKPKLKELIEDAYFSARLKAALDTKLDESTFPQECPWSVKEIFPGLEKKYC